MRTWLGEGFDVDRRRGKARSSVIFFPEGDKGGLGEANAQQAMTASEQACRSRKFTIGRLEEATEEAKSLRFDAIRTKRRNWACVHISKRRLVDGTYARSRLNELL